MIILPDCSNQTGNGEDLGRDVDFNAQLLGGIIIRMAGGRG